MITTTAEKRKLNFELALQDELMQTFGRETGNGVLERLKLVETRRMTTLDPKVDITFEILPHLGPGCLADVLGRLFHSPETYQQVARALDRAIDTHRGNGGNGLGERHCECAFSYNHKGHGKKLCMAIEAMKKLSAKKAQKAAPPAGKKAATHL